MERKNLKDILLNYKKLGISPSIIEKYCFLDEYNFIEKIQYDGLKNIYRFRFYIFEPADILKIKNNTKIEINPKGLFINIDINGFLKQLESIYNIKLIDCDIEESIKAIRKLQSELRNIKKTDELSNISPLIKKDYIIFRETNIKSYLKKYKRSYIEHILLQQYMRNQLDNLNYLAECLQTNFFTIRSCNNCLPMIDKNKLALVLAYQIMQIDQKQSAKHTLTYLKEYLRINEEYLNQNYGFQKRIINSLNVSETKKFSIRTIYNYLQKKINPAIEKVIPEQSVPEQYDYNFLDTSSNTKEILSKYYQLGLEAKNDIVAKELLERKITYYSSMPVTKIKIGKNSFSGYIGFCLENGNVILDKFFEDIEKGIIAVDQAIYFTEEENFEQVTRLTKQACMEKIKSGKIKAKRINHIGKWEKRIDSYQDN